MPGFSHFRLLCLASLTSDYCVWLLSPQTIVSGFCHLRLFCLAFLTSDLCTWLFSLQILIQVFSQLRPLNFVFLISENVLFTAVFQTLAWSFFVILGTLFLFISTGSLWLAFLVSSLPPPPSPPHPPCSLFYHWCFAHDSLVKRVCYVVSVRPYRLSVPIHVSYILLSHHITHSALMSLHFRPLQLAFLPTDPRARLILVSDLLHSTFSFRLVTVLVVILISDQMPQHTAVAECVWQSR